MLLERMGAIEENPSLTLRQVTGMEEGQRRKPAAG